MRLFIFFILLLSVSISSLNAQNNTMIEWKTWAELEQSLKDTPKPVFLFFHSESCVYCKKIERQVFTKPTVIEKLNTGYYAVEMDVERTDIITFEGMQFNNKEALSKRHGIHALPLLLASRDGVPFSVPATIVLNKDFTLKDRVFEYYTTKQLLKLL